VPFKIVNNDLIPFRLEVAKRIAALNAAIGWPADASIAAADRARVRTQVAREFFLAERGREPVDTRELAGQIAKDSRPRTQTVAGYDLTFSPVKSVSTLWAVADPAVAAVIERAHEAAVKDALAFIEKHALFTRTGPQGIRQVNVRGLIGAAFTHRDSRAGDPDLLSLYSFACAAIPRACRAARGARVQQAQYAKRADSCGVLIKWMQHGPPNYRRFRSGAAMRHHDRERGRTSTVPAANESPLDPIVYVPGVVAATEVRWVTEQRHPSPRRTNTSVDHSSSMNGLPSNSPRLRTRAMTIATSP
jgi:TrwC relaxase